MQVQWNNCTKWIVAGYWLLRVCSCPLRRLLFRQRRRLPGPVQALRAEGIRRLRLCLLHSLPAVKKCTSSENSRMPQWLFGPRWEGGWAPCRSRWLLVYLMSKFEKNFHFRTPGCTWHLIWTSWTFNQIEWLEYLVRPHYNSSIHLWLIPSSFHISHRPPLLLIRQMPFHMM